MTHEQTRQWADRVNLDNLVPYTHASAAWSDRHSNVALTWNRPEAGGLQMLQALVGWGGSQITTSTLTWTVAEGGQALPLEFRSRNFRPDKVVETAACEGLELTATAAWPERNAVAVEFELRNLADKARALVVSFDQPGKGIAPDWKGPFPAGHFVAIEGEPPGSWSTLFAAREHGRNVVWVRDFAVGMTDGTTFDLVCLADLSDREIRVGAGARERVVVVMAFGRTRGAAQEVRRRAAEKIAAGWTPGDETRRWREIFRRAQPLPPKYAGQERYERMYAHAIAGLNGLFIRGDGGYTGEKRVPWTTKFMLAIAFFWDTSFSCTGTREFDPALAQEAISCFADNASPRGSLPGTICDSHRAGEGQAPIMTWAAWLTYKRSHDKAWLAHVYPALCGHNRYWFKYHVSPRGLAEYYNAGQIGDNDARFDPVYGKETGNLPVHGFESPDLNAFLVVDMRCLGFMARELDRSAEAAEWQAKADALARRIVDACYFPEEAMFYDVAEGTHEKFSGVKNPNMFIPLWAGVPLPKEEVRRIVEKHMLNPDEFFRELPFPSLSYDNPKYNPMGYWRGRIWPHFVFWMIQGLWRQGYHKEAELTADRLLAMFQKTPWFHENYDSIPGAAAQYPGLPEYNWANATVIELLLERYKEPLDD